MTQYPIWDTPIADSMSPKYCHKYQLHSFLVLWLTFALVQCVQLPLYPGFNSALCTAQQSQPKYYSRFE